MAETAPGPAPGTPTRAGVAPPGTSTLAPAPVFALADVAAWLTKEIEHTHVAIMGVHHFAVEDKDPMVQLNCMKAAARMMQAQAAAAMSLQRLTGGKGLTVTIVHEKRNTPPPKKSKTNTRPPEENSDQVTEDELAWLKEHGYRLDTEDIQEAVDPPGGSALP